MFVSVCWCRCVGVEVLCRGVVSMYWCRCVGVDVLVVEVCVDLLLSRCVVVIGAERGGAGGA